MVRYLASLGLSREPNIGGLVGRRDQEGGRLSNVLSLVSCVVQLEVYLGRYCCLGRLLVLDLAGRHCLAILIT